MKISRLTRPFLTLFAHSEAMAASAILYPGATYRPLGRQTQPLMKAHNIICLHTEVGHLFGTDQMFMANGYGGTESHLGIGGIWGPDLARGLHGKAYQWQDLRYTADANLEGNPEVISIETADNFPRNSSDILPWTPRQCDAIVTALVWLCRKESHARCPVSWKCHQVGIPVVLIPDTKPGRRGIGYHRQGILHSDGPGSHPGWLVRGGKRWSSSTGKPCPTEARIKQISTIIIPRVKAALEEDVVLPADRTAIAQQVAAVVNATLDAKIEGAVERVLNSYNFIPNPGIEPGDAAGGLMSVKTVLQNIETNQDQQGSFFLKPILTLLQEIKALLAPKT
jgi:hypothetical protein